MYQLLKLPSCLGKGLYALGESEIARVYGVNNESAVPADAVAGVIMNTIFGFIVVGGSYGTTRSPQGLRGTQGVLMYRRQVRALAPSCCSERSDEPPSAGNVGLYCASLCPGIDVQVTVSRLSICQVLASVPVRNQARKHRFA